MWYDDSSGAGALQSVAVRCSVLQCVAGTNPRHHVKYRLKWAGVLQCVAVRCSVRDIQTRMVRVSIFGPELWRRWKRQRGGGSEVVCVCERERQRERERWVEGRINPRHQVIWWLKWCGCVAVCCSLLQSVAVCCSALQEQILDTTWYTDSNGAGVLQCVAMCCSVLQCVCYTETNGAGVLFWCVEGIFWSALWLSMAEDTKGHCISSKGTWISAHFYK